MKNWQVIVMLLVSLLGCADIKADEVRPIPFEGVYPTYSYGINYVSEYVWRGQKIQDDGFQPSINISYQNLTACLWGNAQVEDRSEDTEFNEVNYMLEYKDYLSFADGVVYNIGVIYYDFPNTKFQSTTEIYTGLTFENIIFSPSIIWYQDIDEVNGSYIGLAAQHVFTDAIGTLGNTCDIILDSTIGYGSKSYNRSYFGVNSSALNDFGLAVTVPVALNEDWTLSPSLVYNRLLDGDIQSSVGDNDHLYFGISLIKKY